MASLLKRKREQKITQMKNRLSLLETLYANINEGEEEKFVEEGEKEVGDN